jgi:hypothetical protein
MLSLQFHFSSESLMLCSEPIKLDETGLYDLDVKFALEREIVKLMLYLNVADQRLECVVLKNIQCILHNIFEPTDTNMKQKHFLSENILFFGISAFFLSGSALATVSPVATYSFNNTLAAQESGVASLNPVNPLGTNGFTSDTVLGQTRQVYQFNGNVTTPDTQQAGLSLNTNGLVTNNNYSVNMVFKFTQGDWAWRRIIDVENRQSDNGFYVDPSNLLSVYPVSNGGATFIENTYHDVALVNSSGIVSAYIDGTLSFSAATNVMNINNAGNLMNFFLDNTDGGGIGEYSSGRVALISLYSSALTANDVAYIASNPFVPSVPEPEEYGMMLLGFGMVGYQIKRKQKQLAKNAI